MLRRAAPALLRRMLASSAPPAPGGARIPMHQPLGVPPPGTDNEAVRAKWGSNAMDMVQAADVIRVPGPVATCDGGGGPLGHPIEYIQIDRGDAQHPAVCKYCGNKYVADH
jgi:uncharacterized Zn-finger protein